MHYPSLTSGTVTGFTAHLSEIVSVPTGHV